jgi:ESCRT-II complex subunit VPS36
MFFVLSLSLSLTRHRPCPASGVLVVQSITETDEHVQGEILALLEMHTSLSAEQLARLRNSSAILAREQLLLAERAGRICRDDTMEGLRFYRNRFLLA